MISTSIFSAATLLYLSIGVGAAITILYLLKLKKRRVEVPFSPIWKNVLAPDAQAQDWRRYLRRIFSWLFYLLIAALILIAIYDPHEANEATKARHVLLLVDTSASMSSTDVTGAVDRLDAGKKKVSNLLKSLDSTDRVMLATFNEVVQPQTPFVSDISIIKVALQGLQVTATGTNFENAISFAADSLGNIEDSELIWVTDGASASFPKILEGRPGDYVGEGVEEVDDEEELKGENEENRDVGEGEETYGQRLKGTKIQLITVGESADNLAITSFMARRYLANRLDYELLVQVQSYFNREIDAEIDLYADGKLIDTKPIHLTENGLYQQFYPSQAVSGNKLEARVRVTTPDAQDDFPMDDVAYAVLPKTELVDVLLVTSGNLYLEGPLLLNPNIKLKVVASSSYMKMTDDEREKYSVIIFDGMTYPSPERANVLYINPQGDYSPWQNSGKKITDPIIARMNRRDPLLRWMSLQDMNIKSAQKVTLGRHEKSVAAAVDGTPMIIARDEGKRRIVGVMFDVRESDFPLRVSFPVFMINVLDWFTGENGTLLESYRTGESWKVKVPKGVTEVTVTEPSGGTSGFETETQKQNFPVFDQYAYIYGATAGFYTVTSATEGVSFKTTLAANLADRKESAIKPEMLEGIKKEDAGGGLVARQEPWRWLVFAALVLLLLEWITYNRRVTE